MTSEPLVSSSWVRRFPLPKLMIILGIVYLGGTLNWIRPTFRFSSEIANGLAADMIALAALALIVLAFWLKRWWVKALAALAILFSVAVTIFWTALITYVSYPQASVSVGKGRAVPVCGKDSLGAWHFKVRYEVPLLPGLLNF